MADFLTALAARLLPGPGEPPAVDGRPRAAVAALFHRQPDGHRVLLMERAVRDGDPWSGHVSLPGGRHERHDPDLLTTATRETVEELAVDLRDTDYLGRLAPLHPLNAGPHGMEVTPYVFVTDVAPATRPSAEAAGAFWLPVESVLSGALDGTFEYRAPMTLTLPCWRFEGRVVWGLTLRILDDLLFPAARAVGMAG